MLYKTCSKCKKKLFLDNFHKNTGRIRPDCKECVADYSKKYREVNRNKIKQKKKIYNKEKSFIKRRSYLKLEYNMSLQDYEDMLKNQNFKCAICESLTPKSTQHKHFHIDHCHKTGKIRGLLCAKCNISIGQFEDNVDWLKRAIEYLNKSQLGQVFIEQADVCDISKSGSCGS